MKSIHIARLSLLITLALSASTAVNAGLVNSFETAMKKLPKCVGDDVAKWDRCVGTHRFSNGNVYTGEWLNGERSGFGKIQIAERGYSDENKIRSATPATYTGQFRDNKINGRGSWVEEDGASFVGEFSDNKLITVLSTLTSRKSETNEGKRRCSGPISKKWNSCSGTYAYPNGNYYSGEYKNGLPNGNGTLTHLKDGSYLSGNFTDGILFGRVTGKIKGVGLDATFIRDQPVFGKMFFAKNAGFYEGDIDHWSPNGLGRMTFADGMQVLGNFDQGRCVGTCYVTSTNGIIAAVQMSADGMPIPNTAIRIDEGSTAYYSANSRVENGFTIAGRIVQDQLNAFQNVSTQPQMLNQSSPVTIINYSNQPIGNGVMWTTQQPGMLGGGNFIKLQ